MTKTVLIITYYWPPSGGPGVQRALKFAKYLPLFGWKPIILTIKDGEYPAIDHSLHADVSAECQVYKTDAIEPNSIYRKFTGMSKDQKIPVGNLAQKDVSFTKRVSKWVRLNLFVPDAKIGWIPYAVKQGKKIIEEEQPDLIFSTSPPPSVHLIAKKLAKWSGIKWVADFRDPWTKIHYLQDQHILYPVKKYNAYLERSVIASCDKAICVSQNFVDLLTVDCKDKFEVVTNGFDSESLQAESLTGSSTTFDILYIGGLNWNRYYKTFFLALHDLLERGVLPQKDIRILFAGSIDPDIKAELDLIFKNMSCLVYLGYIDHSKAVSLMYQSRLLLLFLEQVDGYEGHIPGKLFEYISTHNPILGVGNTTGESANILTSTQTGQVFDPAQTEEMKTEIVARYHAWLNKDKPKIDEAMINQYSRKLLTQQLSNIFNKV